MDAAFNDQVYSGTKGALVAWIVLPSSDSDSGHLGRCFREVGHRPAGLQSQGKNPPARGKYNQTAS